LKNELDAMSTPHQHDHQHHHGAGAGAGAGAVLWLAVVLTLGYAAVEE
jgi:hypothetical protein